MVESNRVVALKYFSISGGFGHDLNVSPMLAFFSAYSASSLMLVVVNHMIVKRTILGRLSS